MEWFRRVVVVVKALRGIVILLLILIGILVFASRNG